MVGDEGRRVRVTKNLAVPLTEITVRATTSSGPGGQHANRSLTKVVVTFDVAASAALTEHQRRLLMDKYGARVTASASDQRSQAQNRSLALSRLVERLAIGLHVEAPRHPTKPSKGAKERRLDSKRRRSDVKRLRSDNNDD